MLLRHHLSSALIAAALLFPSAWLLAQPAPPASAPQHHEMPKPTNLKILPKNISSKDLIRTMHQFTGGLGVHCNYCHVENTQTHRFDFASDAKPEKSTARLMMHMTYDLNAKYMAKLSDHDDLQEAVGCGTCHRGQSKPAVFVSTTEEQGPPPAPSK